MVNGCLDVGYDLHAALTPDGTAQGVEDVRSIVVTAKELYEHQEFRFAGPVGDYGFLEDYTTQVRGEHISVIVAVPSTPPGRLSTSW